MNVMDNSEIRKFLPHRYPFLLVDRILEIESGKKIRAIKNVTANEPFFTGHFPNDPIMPGVLMIEALAQASGILLLNTMGVTEQDEKDMFFLAGVDEARFKRMVLPGDQLQLDIEVVKHRLTLWKFKGTATVDGELACSATFMVIKDSSSSMKDPIKTTATRSSATHIDPSAVIDPSAIIHENVKIGAWSVIGPNVEIGSGTTIFPHTIISKNTKIGRNNEVHSFSVIGGDPQDSAYHGEETHLIIGDNNIIREYVTISRGSVQADRTTRIGNNNFIFAYCHIGHDCQVGNHVLMTNNATLAGFVRVDDHAKLGAFTAVHQFCRVGSHSFITRGALVNHDVLPYVMVTSHTSETRGLNLIGLQRAGFSEESVRQLKRAYNVIFRRGLKLAEIIEELKGLAKESPEISLFIDLIENSERGFVR